MKKLITLTLFVLTASLYTSNLSAKGRVSIGTSEIIERVADLPNTDDYLADDGSGNNLDIKLYMDLAIKYKRFEIARMPFWIVEEPVFVGIDNFHKEDGYYDLTEEEINAILKENKLNREEMLHLGFWSKHGGLLILAILVVIYLLYLKFSPKEKEDEIEYNNEENQS